MTDTLELPSGRSIDLRMMAWLTTGPFGSIARVHSKDTSEPVELFDGDDAAFLCAWVEEQGKLPRQPREPERCCPTCGTPERDQPPEREWKGLR